MADLARRFPGNPILRPADVRPSRPDLTVECLLNPGAFRYQGRTGLLLRVAELSPQSEEHVTTPVIDPTCEGGIRVISFRRDDPKLSFTDPRVFSHEGRCYLTTLSHLRLAWSHDGADFVAEEKPTLIGEGDLELFGLEDCRVAQIGPCYYLTYTAVSPDGIGVAMSSTQDWRSFTRHGMLFPPCNKDCALFPEEIGGHYYALHRPSTSGFGGHFIWLSRSPDLEHWGRHTVVARTRPGMWDSQRIGAGASPIRTEAGWLEIYHGADAQSRYCLGALLLDLHDPTKVLARSREPIMEPTADYEQRGFFGNVVFTNGHVVDGDTITVYYGASDSVICGARLSIREILASLEGPGVRRE